MFLPVYPMQLDKMDIEAEFMRAQPPGRAFRVLGLYFHPEREYQAQPPAAPFLL
jgi:hypothetical protein